MANPVLLLIDGSGLCYRAHYALSGLATSYGQPTGAVFGFINMLNRLLKSNPEYSACCFDISKDTLRSRKYSEYKMNRQKMPDELISQLSFIRRIVSAYNIPIIESSDYEADDIIASLTFKAGENNLDVLIASSDKDMLQLIKGGVKVWDPRKEKDGVFYDYSHVDKRYGVGPDKLADVFSLMGDASDNIPGAKGIGEKTAVKLIKEFGSMKGLLDNSGRLKSKAIRKAVEDNIDNIRMSYDLFKLSALAPVDFDLDGLRRKQPNFQELFEIYKKLEFNKMLKELPVDNSHAPDDRIEAVSWEDNEARGALLDLIKEKTEVCLYYSRKDQEKVYFYSGRRAYFLRVDSPYLARLLSDKEIKKTGYDFKNLRRGLSTAAPVIEGLCFDVMLAAYVLDPAASGFGLGELALKYLNLNYARDELSACEALNIIEKLKDVFRQRLKSESLEKLFYELEMPLTEVLFEMESAGVKVDAGELRALSQEVGKKLISLSARVYALNSGVEFNINSPKQLADVLFARLKLPVVKKAKTGPSTDEEVLRRLSQKHKLPLLILEYRQLAKLKSTYIDSLPNLIDAKTKRIHGSFEQTGTETGRLSSNNPNLQNIPVKGDVANLIRGAFIAQEGSYLVCADYSQIELRILAHFSKDENLIRAFNNGLDVHTHTASLVFNAAEEAVTDEMRASAKKINFGIVYGMSGFGLAKDLGITHAQAQDFIDSYFLRYPGVKAFIDAQINSARALGYVETLSGRRRYLKGINSPDNYIRMFSERQAVNSPIQGSAADLIKQAMINVSKAFKEKGLDSKMIMQIHDELVFEIRAEEINTAPGLIKEAMETAIKLLVAVKVKIRKGKNWFDMQTVSFG